MENINSGTKGREDNCSPGHQVDGFTTTEGHRAVLGTLTPDTPETPLPGKAAGNPRKEHHERRPAPPSSTVASRDISPTIDRLHAPASALCRRPTTPQPRCLDERPRACG